MLVSFAPLGRKRIIARSMPLQASDKRLREPKVRGSNPRGTNCDRRSRNWHAQFSFEVSYQNHLTNVRSFRTKFEKPEKSNQLFSGIFRISKTDSILRF